VGSKVRGVWGALGVYKGIRYDCKFLHNPTSDLTLRYGFRSLEFLTLVFLCIAMLPDEACLASAIMKLRILWRGA
jgi:hypothetical protein